MQVLFFYFFGLVKHITIIFVDEDCCDLRVAGDVGDKLWVIDELAIGGDVIVVGHGWVGARCFEGGKEIIPLVDPEANR